jgi:CubicO group peptidase (beta-lactamase class C family)
MKRTFLNCLDRLNCLDLSRHHSRFRRLNRLNRLDFLLKPARLLALSCLLLALQGSPSAQDTDWRTLIEEWRTTLDVPGMSVGIIRDGQVVFEGGFGVLEKGGTAKCDEHTLYAIASNTKAFISAALATLVDEGRIDWDDPVRKYLPYFELYDPCVSDMITIRDLLCHRAGLGEFSGDVIWYRSQYAPEEVLRHAPNIPQAFSFRNGFGYSNVMYIAAGEVIRAVTGKSWATYVQEEFLTPLGMDRTRTSVDGIASVANVATPHLITTSGDKPTDWVAWDAPGAAGGILSSVHDMLKWADMQLSGGIADTDTFFSAASQRTMWTTHVNYPVSDAARKRYGGRDFNGYGLGWGTTEYNNSFVVSHTGGYDGMYSAVVLLPSEKIGIVVLTNAMKSLGTLLAYDIVDHLTDHPAQDWRETALRSHTAYRADRDARVDQRIKARKSGTLPTMNTTTISGLYRCPMFGDIRIEHGDEGLMIDFVKAPDLKARLTHWHDDTYRINWLRDQPWFDFGTVQIRKDNNGAPDELLFDVPNDDIFFEEIHAKRVKS